MERCRCIIGSFRSSIDNDNDNTKDKGWYYLYPF